ncbi:TonB-dependent receptor [Burkholderiaceae bacterium DAT-1]|nr:TonB-dependent receptor [Burkholderiaceae bacterium DAT-1]
MRVNRIVAALVAAGLVGGAFAEEPVSVEKVESKSNDRNASDAPKRVERIEVTGSSIKRIDKETASPLQVVSRQQIDAMGANTLQEILTKVPGMVQGAGEQDFNSLFSGWDGASGANLRGLGAHSTLTLLNGRRLANFGAPMNFQHQFVNIDAIPADAIERIEILADGASAVYGSDAIAGVMNIITKSSYKGLEVKGNAQSSIKSATNREMNASVSYGFGDLEADGYNLYGSFSHFKRMETNLDKVVNLPGATWNSFNPTYWDGYYPNGSSMGEINPGTQYGARSVAYAGPGCKNIVQPYGPEYGSNCVVNTLKGGIFSPESDRNNLYLNGHYRFNDNLQGFAELSYTTIDMGSNVGPGYAYSGSPGYGGGWYARNTGTNFHVFEFPYLSANHPYNIVPADKRDPRFGGATAMLYQFQDDISLFRQSSQDREYRVVAGLKGAVGAWDWEAGLTLAGSRAEMHQRGSNMSVSGMTYALGNPDTGKFDTLTVQQKDYYGNPVPGDVLVLPLISPNARYQFGQTSAANRALLEKMYPDVVYPGHDRFTTLDAKLSGRIAELPAGDVMLAAGGTVSRQYFSSPGDAAAANGDIWWQGGSWFEGGRTVGAVFSEVLVPVSGKLELNVAARVDKYPGFSTNVVPKVGLKYAASEALLVRGSYSEGFRAPSLAESGNGGVYRIVSANDQYRCEEASELANVLINYGAKGDVKKGNDLQRNECGNQFVGGVTRPNPDLQPEKTRISSAGFVFQPVKWFDVSADYFFFNRKNEIIQQDATVVLADALEKYGKSVQSVPGVFLRAPKSLADADIESIVARLCKGNPGACPVVPTYTLGKLAGVTNSFINQGKSLVDGFDVSANARWNLGEAGNLSFNWQATYKNRNKITDPEGQWSDNAVGTYMMPRLTSTFAVNWGKREYNASLMANYVGPQALRGVGASGESMSWFDPSWEPDSCANNPTSNESICKNGLPSSTYWTLNLGWQPVRNLNLNLNMQNLLDHRPAYDPRGGYGANGYEYLGLYGRIVRLSAGYKFW